MPPDTDLFRWLLALAAATAIAGAAFRFRGLSPAGAFTAAILGTTIVGAAGWWSGFLLVAFFVTASLLSRTGRDTSVVSAARGSRRDAVQVFANGGVALVCALGYLGTGHHAWLLALAGSLAAAAADTWSTEIGRTSPSRPRLITSGKPVPAGTSGAISRRGLAGAAAGGTMIGTLAATGAATSGLPIPWGWATVLLAVTLAGVAGALTDSLLGATLQDQRWCDTCDLQTELRIHRCGTPTRLSGGIPWITNDVVNAGCVITGAVLASAIGFLIG
jgi:uncharacterized protein (TIGR00297 family)